MRATSSGGADERAKAPQIILARLADDRGLRPLHEGAVGLTAWTGALIHAVEVGLLEGEVDILLPIVANVGCRDQGPDTLVAKVLAQAVRGDETV